MNKRYVVFVMECEQNEQNALVCAVKNHFSLFKQGKLVAIQSGKPHRAIFYVCEQLIQQKLMPKTSFVGMFGADLLEFAGFIKPKKESD